MFVLSSDVTIGNFRFSGLHQLRITRSIHSYVDTATIQLPSICQVNKQGVALPGKITTGTQFKDGDAVLINLGYNGQLQQEFQGFVKHRNLDMPLTVECEGYSWLLRHKSVSILAQSITVKDLLTKAIDGTGISLQCTVNIALTGVTLQDKTAADVIDFVLHATDGNLTVFFISPQVLWVGLVYSPYAASNDVFALQQVSYKPGYNCIKNNSLRQRSQDDDPVVVNYPTKLQQGGTLTGKSKALQTAFRNYKKTLGQVKQQLTLNQLAQEKAYRTNYAGYEGHITGFLQPYVQPGYKAYITDARYPDLAGTYLAESVEVQFGISGARRLVEIGPKIGFAP